jgi:LysM repeat protein
MVQVGLRHIAVSLVAACLTGCGNYAVLDPETTASFTSSGKQAGQGAADPETTGSTSAPSDTAALSSLFARAAAGKLNDDPAPPTPATKPLQSLATVADAGDTAIPAAPGAGEKIAEPRGRAYLFRGVAGLIYSRGMDRLEERIKQAGIAASVDTYLMWRSVADQAIRDYRRDPAPITLIGHSMGGDSALAFAEALNSENIPVSLLVTYDPSRIADDVPPNVERYINLYQSSNFMGGGNVVQGSRFHGHYASYNLKDHSEIIHINIEKTERIQEQLVTKIAQLAGTPASAEGEAVPIRLEVPADAAIELWDSGLPVRAHAGDTLKSLADAYHVPLWALAQINSVSDSAPLNEGQRIVVPRHLVAMAIPSTVTSYAPAGR